MEEPYSILSSEAVIRTVLSLRLVDEKWYRQANGLSDAGSPLAHFLSEGWRSGAAPNPFFDPGWYLSQNLDLPDSDDGLTHYVLYGESEGRWPCRLLDPAWYAAQHDLKLGDGAVLSHYLRYGAEQGLKPNPIFDPKFYLKTNRDLPQDLRRAAIHYAHTGYIEARSFGEGFDALWYRRTYMGDGQSDDPLHHYLTVGQARGHARHPKKYENTAAELRRSTAPGQDFEEFDPNLLRGKQPRAKIIAFYLPQFHAIPENDEWWGTGFTEWRNVCRGQPRFVGHHQPRIPRDLGFYDLVKDPTVMPQQIELAKAAGIYGFCFYYYQFGERKLLEKPIQRFLADPSLDFPFCLMWANENWTRRWDGQESEILLEQKYQAEDDEKLIREIALAMQDPRYIRVSDRPLFIIYRPGAIPEMHERAVRWRRLFRERHDVEPWLLMAQVFHDHDPTVFGLDGAVEFPPHKLNQRTARVTDRVKLLDLSFTGDVWNYDDIVASSLAQPTPPYPLIRTVVPSWDNDARRQGSGDTFAFSTPAAYQRWLERLIDWAREHRFGSEPFLCVNAWNEWAEGAYLEPDVHFGAAYLNATARAVVGDGAAIGGDKSRLDAWNECAEGAYLEPDRHLGYAHLAETTRVLRALDGPPLAATLPNDTRIRLALVVHDAHFHGAQVVALDLARALVLDHGVDLTVLIGGPGELTSQFEAVAHTELVPGNFDDLAAWQCAAQRLAAAGVTAVLCNTLVSARAIAPLREAGLRIVQLVHELPSLIHQYGLVAASRDAADHAAAVVFPSAYVRARFREIAEPIRGRAVIRHQGLNMRRLSPAERQERRSAIRAEFGIGMDRRVVLGIGYGDVRKGLDLWPALIRCTVERCDNAVFVWIGRVDAGLLHWMEHDLRESGMSDRLLMPGITGDLPSVYAAADAFVLTSREDPFPSVVIGAMASGLPTVVFDRSGGIVELVRDTGGAVVPYLDIAAMGDMVAHLLQDRAAAEAMGERLAAQIAKNFDYRDYAADLIALATARRPLVSAIVPNFNYARHLRQRLESIWGQTSPVDELIILDDASSDDSASVIEGLVAESPIPVQVVYADVNSGSVSRQWARGVSLARGDIVWIAEADDFADLGFLAAVLPAFEDPEVVLSYSESRMVDEVGQVLATDYRGYVGDIDPARWTADYKAAGPVEVALALSVKNTVPNVSAVAFRRTALASVLETHLDAMVKSRNAADWFCYIHLLKDNGAIAFTARVLNNHRRHRSSVTNSTMNRQHLKEIVDMQELAATVVAVSPEIRAIATRYRNAIAGQFGIQLDELVR